MLLRRGWKKLQSSLVRINTQKWHARVGEEYTAVSHGTILAKKPEDGETNGTYTTYDQTGRSTSYNNRKRK